MVAQETGRVELTAREWNVLDAATRYCRIPPRGKYIVARLAKYGFVQVEGDRVIVTADGIAYLGYSSPTLWDEPD